MRRSKLTTIKLLAGVISVAAVLAAAALGAPSASATEPWWRLASSSTPTVLQAGQAKDEVQELKVAATGGYVTVLEPASLEEFEKTFNFAVLKYGCFHYDATHEDAQAAIEAAYGAGNVEVSGGPGDEKGTKPYAVTFTGGLADRPVKPMATSPAICSFFGNEALEGEATATEQAQGRPDGDLVITAANLGDADLSGEKVPVTITDTLPAGLTAISAEGVAGPRGTALERAPVRCALEGARSVSCTFEGTLPPFETIEVQVGVVLNGAKSGEENEVALTGGNTARTEPLRWPITVGGETPFGVTSYALAPEEEGGTTDTQAGSHPFQLTTTLTLNSNFQLSRPPAMVKDLNFHLPPGLLGNPTPFPQCTEAQFTKVENLCPNDTAVGVASVDFLNGGIGHVIAAVPLFNLVPVGGEPARFGFKDFGVAVYLDTSVRTGGDYGVTVSVKNITQVATLLASRVTFWGVPGDPRHDNSRGWSCIDDEGFKYGSVLDGACNPLGEHSPPPLLSLPTSCTGPLQSSMEADSWQDAGTFETYGLSSPLPTLDGCNRLPFSPSISVAPDSEDASTPSGLTVRIHVPQQLVLNPTALAESTVKDTTVALPEGVSVNPGGADGLEACSEAQIGYLGTEAADEDATGAFSSTLPEPFCSDAAKVGTVKITTPLLPNPLTGAVYLASPAPNGEAGMNPFRTLLALYIVAEDPVSGTLVKLPGKVLLNPKTGQLVSTFENTPQLPFEDLTLHFFGGGRAPLATPGLCGTYTTSTSITPWSGNPPATPSSSFHITAGPNGSACQNPQPFNPEFQTGTTNIQAGAFSELRTTMGHPDADQTLGGLSMKLPPGLMGSLAHVKLCAEPQAAIGTCGPESLIGHTVVTAGLGSEPVVVKRPGNVYITGPYNGHGACTVGEAGCAPYGLSIVNPAEAGPFNLGDVIVRAKIEVDPHTAQLSIVSDPLPTIIKGIPLQIQHVAVSIDREHFTFNPTSCEKMQITGSMSSSQGTVAPISSPFQVTNCASLPFKPGFKSSTKATHTRRHGAYLHVTMSSTEPQGDVREVHVELPRALPSRLSTLQKACTEATFARNPADCPAESVVGHAVVHTPLLPVPLTGPAYFVSHGGAKFPELIMVLQGYGVTVQVDGETYISKKGITSSTFKSVPDVPFTTFRLILPTGSHSALAGNGNFCRKKLVMPTRIVGQNGKRIEKNIHVKAQGCKPAIYVVKHAAKDSKATIGVHVPSAGRLVATGKGIAKTVRKAGKAGRLTVHVHLTQHGKAVTSAHKHRRMKVAVHLKFKRKHGRALKTGVTLLLR